ncbi:MAG: L-rhamnose/proton symporter RhaT, partial [Puniceicoccales bacterium]|nr:L-rhamnose/proton symporter RhaT [Puniceicoccales bacterium]
MPLANAAATAANPVLGVIFHWIGGAAAGSFYVPYKGVKKWAWEVYWLVGGFFSWIICPLFFGWLVATNGAGEHVIFKIYGELLSATNATLAASSQAQGLSLFVWPFLFGMMWGVGNATFGLSMRYLGMSLGQGVALGYCTVFGMLMPPILKSVAGVGAADTKGIGDIIGSTGGQVTLVGLAVTVAGIVIAAKAGMTKENEMPEAEKKKAVPEFNFKRGLLVATFSGILSAGMAYALAAGSPIETAFKGAGVDPLWAGIPRLLVILLGGFTSNFAWCAYLNWKNKTGYQYLASHLRPGSALTPAATANLERAAEAKAAAGGAPSEDLRIPRLSNLLFSALAGATWYFQFFFYSMGESKMGDFNYASWTLHMASIIIFATLCGVIFKEWSGVSKKARLLITAGISTLVFSTVIIGCANWIEKQTKDAAQETK